MKRIKPLCTEKFEFQYTGKSMTLSISRICNWIFFNLQFYIKILMQGSKFKTFWEKILLKLIVFVWDFHGENQTCSYEESEADYGEKWLLIGLFGAYGPSDFWGTKRNRWLSNEKNATFWKLSSDSMLEEIYLASSYGKVENLRVESFQKTIGTFFSLPVYQDTRGTRETSFRKIFLNK